MNDQTNTCKSDVGLCTALQWPAAQHDLMMALLRAMPGMSIQIKDCNNSRKETKKVRALPVLAQGGWCIAVRLYTDFQVSSTWFSALQTRADAVSLGLSQLVGHAGVPPSLLVLCYPSNACSFGTPAMCLPMSSSAPSPPLPGSPAPPEAAALPARSSAQVSSCHCPAGTRTARGAAACCC